MEVDNLLKLIAAAPVAILAVGKGALATHDWLRTRRLKFLAFLEDRAKDHPELSETIKTARLEYTARSLFVTPLAPDVASALMRIYQSKQFMLEDLQVSARYAKLNAGGQLNFNPGKRGRLVQAASVLYFLFCSFYGLALAYPFLLREQVGAVFIGLAFVAVFSVVGLSFASDARAVRTAFAVHKKLTAITQQSEI